MMRSDVGKWNIGVGLFVMAGFMLYGFYLIYARDFAPDREAWIAGSAVAPHFEARLAHVHGNLFAVLNVVFGGLLLWLPLRERRARWVSWLALAGFLMPLGILAELYLGLPFYMVLVGAVSIVVATVLLGWEVLHMQAA